MAPGPATLKQRIKQKLLKPKYTPHTDEEGIHLCDTTRSGSADIILDAASPVTSRTSSRPGSTDPTTPQDPHAYHDITASLLGRDAAAAGRSDQGSSGKPGSRTKVAFLSCLPCGKPPMPNEGLPTAFNNKQSILSRLNKAAKKPPQPPSAVQGKAKPGMKAPAVKAKKCQHPLHMAAWRTNINELQEQLLKPGADVNKRDRNSMTPLHYAAWQGSIDCVTLLLEHRADINKADAEGMLPLMFAAMFNRLDVAALLLDRGSLLQPPPAKKGRLTVSWPTTPLVLAAKMGHTEMVALLMERGASIAGPGKASKTALHEAAMCGHADVVEEMLRKGADPGLALQKTGYTALHLAALKGSQSVVQVLLLGGADVDARAKDGRTPLHVACEHGNAEAATALISLGDADLSTRDNSGLTALHVAVDKNHLQLAKMLMDRGAAVDTTSNLGALPLNFAHDPDFYKLLRAVRWYSAASCPTGNNPSSSTYWSPPGAMEATAAAAATVAVPAAVPAPAPAAISTQEPAGSSSSGMPSGYFEAAAAAPDAQYFGSYSSTPVPTAADKGPAETPGMRFHSGSPTQGLINPSAAAAAAAAVPAAPAAVAAAETKSTLFGLPAAEPRAPRGFPARNWLKSLHLPGKAKSKASPLAATMSLAQGGFAPLSAAAAAAPRLPTSTSAADGATVEQLSTPVAGPILGGSPGGEGAAAGQSPSTSRNSSISLAAGRRSAHHSPSPSEGSSVVARHAAAEIARAAVAAVVERAQREEQEIRPAAQEPAAPCADPIPHRSTASSPETWSCTSSVPVPPQSAITASAASGVTTQAALRRLLGFDDGPENYDILGKVAPGDVDPRRSMGDQDKWLPGTAATPSSAATFAAFAAEKSEQDDVKAAAALAAAAHSDSSARVAHDAAGDGSSKPAAPKPSATAAAAAFTAAAAAAAAAAAVGGGQGADDVLRQGSPTEDYKAAGGKRAAKAGKVLRPWRT